MFCKKGAFNILISFRPGTLLKERLQHRCFPVNFAKFSRTPFFLEHLRWLLLQSIVSNFYWIIDEYLTQTYSYFLFNIISQPYFMSLKDIELYSSVQEKKYGDVVLCYWKNLKLFNVLSKAFP